MKTRYVADRHCIVCLDGIRFVKRYMIRGMGNNPEQWYLAWGHKGQGNTVAYPDERECGQMFNRIVAAMTNNGGLIYATELTATSR